MTDKKPNPVTSTQSVAESADGHPLRPASEVSDSADHLKYEDNPDKPHESTVAQVQVKAEAVGKAPAKRAEKRGKGDA